MRVGCGLLLLVLSVDCASTVGASSDGGTRDAAVGAGGLIAAADIQRTCLLAVGCGAASVGSVGACITGLTTRALAPDGTGEDLWDRLLECNAQPAAVASCEAFVDCATRGHPAAYCAAHPGGSCDGNVAVNCGPSGAPATASNCSAIPNAHCLPTALVPQAATYCAVTCLPACAGAGAEAHCDSGPNSPARRCTAGTSCVSTTFFAQEVGVCLPPGLPCSPQVQGCEGDTLVQCVGRDGLFHERRSDCSRLGWHCVDAAARCDPPTSTCSPDDPPTCDGDTLVACAPGASRFDCRALGFARCAPATKTRGARCEP